MCRNSEGDTNVKRGSNLHLPTAGATGFSAYHRVPGIAPVNVLIRADSERPPVSMEGLKCTLQRYGTRLYRDIGKD